MSDCNGCRTFEELKSKYTNSICCFDKFEDKCPCRECIVKSTCGIFVKCPEFENSPYNKDRMKEKYYETNHR